MSQENFSPQESIRVIQSMIDKTRQEISIKSHFYLVWGWITFIACSGQFILKHIVGYDKHYRVWLIIFVGVAYSVIQGIREGKKEKVKTYVGESMQHLWTGMGIAYVLLSFVISMTTGWSGNVFPLFIILYGLGTFVSGSILKFRPLVLGGLSAWLIAIGSVYLDYDYQMLMAALAILVSYIIPAYIFNAREKNQRLAKKREGVIADVQ